MLWFVRSGVRFVALLGTLGLLLFPGARVLAAARPDRTGWTVLFRADDPSLWNTAAGDPAAANGFAVPSAAWPSKIRFVKLTRMDTSSSVIVSLARPGGAATWKPAQLIKSAHVGGDLIWDGGQAFKDAGGKPVVMLGIANPDWPANDENQQMVIHATGKPNAGYKGWGFSRPASKVRRQSYTWAGDIIDATVFEIAVKTTDLTNDEKSLLIVSKPEASPEATPDAPSTPDASASPPAPDDSAAAPAPAVADDQSAGPLTKLARLQSTIKCLSVIPQASGEMLGDAEDFILTATPGRPRGNTIPITFTSAVGKESRMVLDDVCRAVNAKYPHVQAEKYELSFEDKYIGHDGGSIGAACGTPLLSLIEDFDIDPNVAITGDVAANDRVHAIGGVAAKLRGAASAGCGIVALPAENYQQLVDAFVYDGPDSVTNVQVIAINNLDDAVAVCRADRKPKLQQAIDLFAAIQTDLKKNPIRVHSAAMAQRLNQVLELAPNHLSAKLLSLLSRNEEPTTLSGAATYYYANVAVAIMMPGVNDPTITLAAPAVVHEGLAKLVKLRNCGDPQFLPFVNDTWEFMRAMNDYQSGRGSADDLHAKAQLVLDETARLNMDRGLMEKMLHEGV